MTTWTFAIVLSPADTILVSVPAEDLKDAWRALADSQTAQEHDIIKVRLQSSQTNGPHPVFTNYQPECGK